MATKMQLYRGSAANLASSNPILASGELCEDLDDQTLKVGDGVTHWNSQLAPFISKDVLTTKGDLLVATDVTTPGRLGRGTTGQRLTVNVDGTLGWTDAPVTSTLESRVHAEATYKLLSEALTEHALLESQSHAAATYITAATAATQHALYETTAHWALTYMTKALAAIDFEPKWTYKVKAATTTRSTTTTFTADPDLVFPVVAGGKYMFEMNLLYSGLASSDIKFGMVTGLATGEYWGLHGLVTSIASGAVVGQSYVIQDGTNGGTFAIAGTADATALMATIKGTMNCTTSGNYGLTWAQSVSGAGIGTSLLLGSNLKAARVG